MDQEPKVRGWSTFGQLKQKYPLVCAGGKRSLMNRSTRQKFPAYIKLGSRHEPLWKDLEVDMWLAKNLPGAIGDEICAAASERYGDQWQAS